MNEQVNQPTPVFTLLDLEAKLAVAFDFIPSDITKQHIVLAREILHELLGIVAKLKNDLGSIEMPIETAKAITDTIQTEKPEFSVCGVQLIENGILVGTSLYSTVIKARKIRDVLNQRFVELRVDHVAKIVNYPVF